jgi:hypothetical protein
MRCQVPAMDSLGSLRGDSCRALTTEIDQERTVQNVT